MSDDHDDQVRDVYAHFGLAVYMAQVLEHGIVNALVMLEHIPQKVGTVRNKEEWEQSVDVFYKQQFERTLGQLLKALERHTSVNDSVKGNLRECLSSRNFLAHRFFRERAADFMTAKGRDAVIQELEGCRDRFKAADVALEALILPIRRKYYPDDVFEKIHDDYIREIKADI